MHTVVTSLKMCKPLYGEKLMVNRLTYTCFILTNRSLLKQMFTCMRNYALL